MKRITIALSLLLILTLIFATGCRTRPPAQGPVSLTIYGLDNSDVFEPIISAYQDSHKNTRVTYKKFTPEDFENLLVNEIAEGEGPDVFYMHNTWLPRHIKKIVPLTSTTLTPSNFSQTFINVAAQDLIQPDPTDGIRKIYSLPLYVDTLALYYNKKQFEQKVPERGTPAKTWDIFKQEAQLFREETTGQLSGGLIALGRTDNIYYGVDALKNLMLQHGVTLFSGDFKQMQFGNGGAKAFENFVSYAVPSSKNYSWDANLTDPKRVFPELEAFLSGKVAAIHAYSDLYPRLENEIKNTKSRTSGAISFNDVGVAPVPQVNLDASEFKVLADYYSLAVSRNSKKPANAWDFVQFATSQANAKSYHQKTKRPTARRDLIEEQRKEPITEVFINQIGYASTLPVFADSAFADAIKTAVASVTAGSVPREALSKAQTELNTFIKTEAPEGLYPPIKKKK